MFRYRPVAKLIQFIHTHSACLTSVLVRWAWSLYAPRGCCALWFMLWLFPISFAHILLGCKTPLWDLALILMYGVDKRMWIPIITNFTVVIYQVIIHQLTNPAFRSLAPCSWSTLKRGLITSWLTLPGFINALVTELMAANLCIQLVWQ